MKRRAFIEKIGLAALSLQLIPFLNDSHSPIRHSLSNIMGIDSAHLASYANMFLEYNTLQAYRKMKEAAASEGIQLQTISGFKSFALQKNIFENELYMQFQRGYTSLDAYNYVTQYVALPGTSRYHWGTEIDVIDLNIAIPHGYLIDEEHYLPGGMFFHVTQWMERNAAYFDFYLPYTDDVYRKGFAFEPWHYSYKPSAAKILKHVKINELTTKIHTTKIDGLDLIPNSFVPNYIEEYLFGVNKALLYF